MKAVVVFWFEVVHTASLFTNHLPPMAQERIRLTISVTPEVHEVFSRMSQAGGMSLGKCMGEWLTDTIDGAQFVAQKLVEAKAQPRLVMQEMQAMLQGARVEVDAVVAGMRKGGAAVDTRPAGGVGLALPPSSNTGGKLPGKTLPPAKVQAHADTNGVPPKSRGRKS